MQVAAAGFKISCRRHLDAFGHFVDPGPVFFNDDEYMVAGFGVEQFIPRVNYFVTIRAHANKIKPAI